MFDDLIKPAPDHVLKVTELTRQIKAQLERGFTQLWVQGEVSNLRRQSSGHVYFSLKDAGAQLPCVLFARDAMRQSFELKDGMEVLLFGGLSLYEPHGRYQLIAKLAIESGLGRLQVEFERLKRKLSAEGLFEPSRKRPLPVLPRRIAVITSPTGAAIQDFLRILRRRNYGGSVVLFPARVQGRGAAEEITQMLQHAAASPGFDLIVITRGGGSIEDLWAFNQESLARAVADCPIPVISAVGHEIDTVLTDYAADQRAETPSGAAERISSLYIETRQRLDAAGTNLLEHIHTHLAEHLRALADFQSRMRIIAPGRQLEVLGMRLDDMENKLGKSLRQRLAREQERLTASAHNLQIHHPRVRIRVAEQGLRDSARRLERATAVAARIQREKILSLRKRLVNGSLHATLRRGYAILQKPGGEIVANAASARNEDELTARFHDGEIAINVRR